MKQLVENMIRRQLSESDESVMDELQTICDRLKSEYGYVCSPSKGMLGKRIFLKVYGPGPWKSNIPLNSPLTLTLYIYSNVIGMSANSYQVKHANAKMRKTTFKDVADMRVKILDYFKKNKSKFDSILNESLDESTETTIFKLRDMVNKKTDSRLINAGGKLTKFTLDQASKIVSLYDNQKNKNEFETALNNRMGLAGILRTINESLDESTYKVMHKTFTSAADEAKAKVDKEGYTIDDDEWFRKVSSGPRKPGNDKTNRYTVELMKNDKESRKALHFQVYNTGRAYELNAYIS